MSLKYHIVINLFTVRIMTIVDQVKLDQSKVTDHCKGPLDNSYIIIIMNLWALRRCCDDSSWSSKDQQ